MKDAQQDIISELRLEVERHCAARNAAVMNERNKHLARLAELEKELTTRLLLDDPVVKNLEAALKYVFHERLPLGQTVSDYIFEESLERWQSVHQALAAYNAKCKEVGCE